MSRYDGGGSGTAFLAFLLGAVVGAGVAALLSPTSGPENRRRLAELRDDLVDNTDSLRDNAMDKVSDIKEKAGDMVNRGKDFINEQKDLMSSAIEAGKDAYSKEKESQPADES